MTARDASPRVTDEKLAQEILLCQKTHQNLAVQASWRINQKYNKLEPNTIEWYDVWPLINESNSTQVTGAGVYGSKTKYF